MKTKVFKGNKMLKPKSIFLVEVKINETSPWQVVGVFGTKTKAAQCQTKINSGVLGKVFYTIVTVRPLNEFYYSFK